MRSLTILSSLTILLLSGGTAHQVNRGNTDVEFNGGIPGDGIIHPGNNGGDYYGEDDDETCESDDEGTDDYDYGEGDDDYCEPGYEQPTGIESLIIPGPTNPPSHTTTEEDNYGGTPIPTDLVPVPTGCLSGVIGWDKESPVASYVEESGKYATRDACKSLCESKSCSSYAFGAEKCFLYDAPVAGNFLEDRTSPITFFDSACAPDITPISSTPSRAGIPGPSGSAVNPPDSTITPAPTSSSPAGEKPPTFVTSWTSTITYVTVCPTGFSTVTMTSTYTSIVCHKCALPTPTPGSPGKPGASGSPITPGSPESPVTPSNPGADSPIPPGFTTTVTVCTVCGPAPTTVTLTVPGSPNTVPFPNPTGDAAPPPASGGPPVPQQSSADTPNADSTPVNTSPAPAVPSSSDSPAAPGSPSRITSIQTIIVTPIACAYPLDAAGKCPSNAPSRGAGGPEGSALSPTVTFKPTGGLVGTPTPSITPPAFTGAATRKRWSLVHGVLAAGVVGLL